MKPPPRANPRLAAAVVAFLPACALFASRYPYEERTPDQILADAGADLARFEEAEKAGKPDRSAARRALRKLVYLRDRRGGGPDRETLEFRRAQALYASGDRWGAYGAAKDFLGKYRVSSQLGEIERLLFRIGTDYARDEGSFLGLGWFPKRGNAIPVLETLAENYPSGDFGDDALRIVGALRFDGEEWIEARTAYERLLKNYPGSEWADFAEFRIGDCHLREAGTPDLDLASMRKAREAFERYLRNRPEGARRAEAERALGQALEMLAEREWQTGLFYRRIGNTFGAAHHWQAALERYPGTAAAAKAVESLRALRGGADGGSRS